MKLTDLDPRWCAVDGRHGQGLTFVCPACGKGHHCYQGVFFTNPLDGGTPVVDQPGQKPRNLWVRTGEAFETLTLTPSILVPEFQKNDDGQYVVDANGEAIRIGEHWHGFITDGEIR